MGAPVALSTTRQEASGAGFPLAGKGSDFQDRVDGQDRKAGVRLLRRAAEFFVNQNNFGLDARALDDGPASHSAGDSFDERAFCPIDLPGFSRSLLANALFTPAHASKAATMPAPAFKFALASKPKRMRITFPVLRPSNQSSKLGCVVKPQMQRSPTW